MTIDRKRAEVTRRREGEERLSLTGQSPLSRAPVASQRRAKRASVCLDCHSLHREFLATRPAPQGFRVAYSRKVLIKPQGEGIKKRCRSRPNNNCTRRRSGQSRPSGIGGCKANHARRSLESSWVLEHWRDVRQDHGSVKTEREMMRCVFFAVIMVVVCATVAAADSYEDAVSALLHGDHTRAVRLFRPLAEQGLARAQSHLGEMYRTGEGVTQDYQEALMWYRKAAEQGDAWAQYNLGLMYYFGQGIPQDYQEALKWYRQVAERGFARAQYNLGMMYYEGKGVSQDYQEALTYYRAAAKQGLASAQGSLGLMYHEGNGVSQDYQEALKWYREAAKQGLPQAQSNLGVMYDLGQGVPQDHIRAHMWYTVAATAVNGENGRIAKQYRDVVASRLTTVEIRKAQAMARRCQKTKFKQCG
jgi:uncharacterized protein